MELIATPDATPLMVNVHEPAGVPSGTLTVSVELLPLVDAGSKLAVAPARQTADR